MQEPTGVRLGRLSRGRVLAITAGGSVLEYYDYALYGLAAALIFNKQFFPDVSPGVGIILSFATFASGSLVKPLGSLVFSHFGDKVGRARVLFLTMIILGVSTAAIGLLPNYASIGAWAPLGLLLLRLVQGFAAGAEMPGSAVFGVEAAPEGKRGLYGSFTSFGSGVGATLAVFVFMALSAAVGTEAVEQWAWRIPFLFGAVILLFVWIARRGITAMEKEEYEQREDIPDVPLREVLRDYKKAFFGCVGVYLGYGACSGIGAVYFLTYMKQNGFSSDATLRAQLVFQLLIIPLVPVVAMISDKTNRRTLVVIGALCSAAAFTLFFVKVPSSSLTTVYMLIALVAIAIVLMYGGILAFLSEQFPHRVRYSGMGVSFSIGSAIGGGLSPVLAASVMQASNGNALWMSAFALVWCVIAGGSALLLKNHSKTLSADLDEQVTPIRPRRNVLAGQSEPLR
ncbi:MFS transporter [Rhodococcus koreensis]